jgi:rhomboid protease GluP
MKIPFRIHYNAPVTITFALACGAIFITDRLLGGSLNALFTLYRFDPLYLPDYISIAMYPIAHANVDHLLGNLSLVLLLGPILEERYGSRNLLIMMCATSLLTAILHLLIFRTGLIGASGIVFMLIILISFANVKEKTIPLTFILIVLLFIGKEVINMFSTDNISQFAHIIGGACGSVFGFTNWTKKKAEK